MADDSHSYDTRKYKLRSNAWLARQDRDGFARRSWMKNQGRVDHLFDDVESLRVQRLPAADGSGVGGGSTVR